jgi:molybdopterin synthase sulfur carrier subunit
MIKVLYFASLRERLGVAAEEIEADASLATVADIAASLRHRGGIWSEALGEDQTVIAAVNQQMARSNTAVTDGDEVAFFPPVTGG